ncbi:MAG TPA: sulfite exporter TauE/SafE family protein [Burkholderiales bacterium]|nr:sulfite exporter TauE/SafE family protein [Burkholderiales bacterium]
MKILDADIARSPQPQAIAISSGKEAAIPSDSDHPHIQLAVRFSLAAITLLIGILAWRLFLPNGLMGGLNIVSEALSSNIFWIAVAVGFFAQAVDGALGMAYGITATTFLLSSGASPAVASASVHIAEVFTTGFSGIAHVKLGNINKGLFLRLLVPGIVGGIVGALVVTQIDGKILKPYVSVYLLIMGAYILTKAFRMLRLQPRGQKHIGKLALFGGFVDTAGGGGWGPVVTTTLLGNGHDPRTTIGTVNFAEFFLTLASAATFVLLIGAGPWMIVAGLILGGLFAAPFAAFLCRRIPARALLTIVGTLICSLSAFTLYRALI